MIDIEHMAEAIALAERGRGHVEPNPLVGALLVRDGVVVGRGFHESFGQAHAEVNALRQAGDAARGSTLYVTLEPCSHFGKTPPCVDAVIAAGVRRVVFAMLDPFPQVAGQGASRLREAGIGVEVGVGEVEARRQNAPYLKRLRAGRPWVHAKWAMTLDGKIATRTGESQWISGEESRRWVHELRGRMDAILVGKGTLLADDPLLTARPPGPRTPTRIVLATNGRGLPESCKLLASSKEAPVLLVVAADEGLEGWKRHGAQVLVAGASSDGRVDLRSALTELASRGMTNILVEGGADTLGGFLAVGEIDEVHAFVAATLFGGSSAPSPVGGEGVGRLIEALRLTDLRADACGGDIRLNARVG